MLHCNLIFTKDGINQNTHLKWNGTLDTVSICYTWKYEVGNIFLTEEKSSKKVLFSQMTYKEP